MSKRQHRPLQNSEKREVEIETKVGLLELMDLQAKKRLDESIRNKIKEAMVDVKLSIDRVVSLGQCGSLAILTVVLLPVACQNYDVILAAIKTKLKPPPPMPTRRFWN